MALRWMEGFETRQHTDYFGRLYTYTGPTVTAGVAGRKFGSAFEQTQASEMKTPAVVGSVQNTWILQFAVKKSDAAATLSTSVPAFVLQNAAGDQIGLHFVNPAAPDVGGYQLELRRGATVLATTRIFRGADSNFAWTVFQLKVTVRTGTNGSYELRSFNRLGTSTVELGPTSSVNTANQGSDGADRLIIRWHTATATAMAFDDIVLMDSTGSVNNDFTTKPLIVYGEVPNADVGGELDWIPSTGTTHNTLVDDAANSPAGTDEVTSDTVGDVDLYGFSQAQLDLAPTASPPTVRAIMVDMEAAMKNSGTRTLRVRFKDGSNQADDTTDLPYSTTAKVSHQAVIEQNPTGVPAAWTVATLKTIELGPKLNA